MSWNYEKLGNVCEVIAGQSPPSSTYNTEGSGLPFYQGKADFGESYPKVRMWCNEPNKIAKPNDVLLSVRAPVGPTNICDTESCIGRGLAAIRSNGKTDNTYIYYYFKFIEPILSTKGNGSTFSAITINDVKGLEIPIPSLTIQKRIVEILKRADAFRKKDLQLLGKYDELLQSIFIDRFSKAEKSVKLISVCDLINDGVHFKPNYVDNGIPFISVKNITKLYLDFTDCKFVSKEDHDIMKKRCFPRKGDILYTKVGATYGRAAIVDTDEEFSLYVSVCLIKPKKELIRPNFLRMLLNSPLIKKQADKSIKGAGVPDLHLIEIKNFNIPLPSVKEQESFEAIANNLERQISLQRVAIQQSENLFQSLLHKAFIGELIK